MNLEIRYMVLLKQESRDFGHAMQSSLFMLYSKPPWNHFIGQHLGDTEGQGH